MFERFTAGSRKVVGLAQEESAHFNHNYIGTEHLLLGLIKENEGIGARALSLANVTLDEVREQVKSIVGYGEKGEKRAPFTPLAKQVFENALRESLQLRHNYIGTEHILLGLIRESEGVGAQILKTLVRGGLKNIEMVVSLAMDPHIVEVPKQEAPKEEEPSTHEVAIDVAGRIALALERIAAALEKEE